MKVLYLGPYDVAATTGSVGCRSRIWSRMAIAIAATATAVVGLCSSNNK